MSKEMIATKKTRARQSVRSKAGKAAPPYFSRAVGKALEALEILRDSPQPLPLNFLAQKLKLAKSSAMRLLHTLESSGYLARDSGGLYFMASHVRSYAPTRFLNTMITAAVPRLKELSREFRETVSLAALFDNHIGVVASIESPETIRMANIVGRILPPNASSLGKAIIAYQGEDSQQHLLRTYGIFSFTPNTITDEVELKKEFERVRTAGYAEDREESVPGGRCFAVPIFSPNGSVSAAISISLPQSRYHEGDMKRLIPGLQKAAAEISV